MTTVSIFIFDFCRETRCLIEQVFRVLLDGGGDVNHADGAGRTPAMAAALIGDRSLLRFLSASESLADLSLRNADGRTAAFFAAMNGHTGSLAFILGDADFDGGKRAAGDSGSGGSGGGEGKGEATTSATTRSGGAVAAATLDAEDKIGCTPLWTAAAHGHLDTVKYLIDRHGASPNACDVTGTSAAWMTVRWFASSIILSVHTVVPFVNCARGLGAPRQVPTAAAPPHAFTFTRVIILARNRRSQPPLGAPPRSTHITDP